MLKTTYTILAREAARGRGGRVNTTELLHAIGALGATVEIRPVALFPGRLRISIFDPQLDATTSYGETIDVCSTLYLALCDLHEERGLAIPAPPEKEDAQ